MLLNLIITMFIMAILMISLTPDVSLILTKNKAKVAVKAINRAIQEARNIAVTKNMSVTLKPTWKRFAVSSKKEEEGKLALFAADQPLKVFELQVNELYWHGFGNSTKIDVLPTGMTFNNGHFTFRVGKQFCRIYVNHALKTWHECSE